MYENPFQKNKATLPHAEEGGRGGQGVDRVERALREAWSADLDCWGVKVIALLP